MGANQSSRRTSQSIKPLNPLGYAKVVLDSSVPHLDREFDYRIPEEFADSLKIGSRVQVPFGKQKLFGWVVEKSFSSEFSSKITSIVKIVGKSENFTFDSLRLAKEIAWLNAGSLSDVLRFCAPPRHATIEKNFQVKSPMKYANYPANLESLPQGNALLRRVGKQTSVALIINSYQNWFHLTLELIKSAISLEKNALVIVPENGLIKDLHNHLSQNLNDVSITLLSADQNSADRYKSYLDILHKNTQILIGTRNAIFAPLVNNAVIIIFGENSSLFISPQAPYWNVSQVARQRSAIEKSCLIFLSFSLSSKLLLESRKSDLKIIEEATDSNNKNIYFDTNQTKIEKSQFSSTVYGAISRCSDGPVLIVVPRRGEISVLRCEGCYRLAVCATCDGILRVLNNSSGPECARCGRLNADFKCRNCKGSKMSIAKSGQKSVLKEIGSKFSGVNIVSSTGEQRIFHTPDVPSIVVATPQAIPVAAAGYKSIIVLNAEAFFTRPILDLNEEVFHQFKYIKSLLQNGQERALVISGEITDSFMNSFISDEVSAFADFELQQREQLGLPPHRNSLVVSGQRREVEGFKKYFDDDPRVTTMGPVASYQKSVFQIAILHNDPAHYISKARNLLKTLSTKGASTLQIQVDPVDFI